MFREKLWSPEQWLGTAGLNSLEAARTPRVTSCHKQGSGFNSVLNTKEYDANTWV